VRADCSRLLDGLAGAGRAELRRELAGPLAVAAVARVLGLRDVNAATVLGWYSTIVGAVSAITAGEPVDPAAGCAVAELAAAVGVSIGAEHHSLLAGAVRPAGELTEAEAVSNAAVLMFGGIDTTEAMIANLLWLLLSDRTRWQAVLADRGLVPVAVEESLRLEPAAAVVDRYSTTAVELAGARIGERELVRVSITGANRDPTVFADPNSFRLDRPKLACQLAFARGPHFCLGMELARVQATAVLEQLLDRLPGARLDPTDQPGPRGLVFRKPAEVWVRWD
jgi:cytochrome P450